MAAQVLGKGPSVELVLKDFIPGAAPGEAEADSAASDDPDWSHPPKLFAISADGSGVEYLREADVLAYIVAVDQ